MVEQVAEPSLSMSDIKLFRLSSGKATELQGDASDLEKPLQTLIEANLEPLLGISMDKVLESMSLPEPICDALLGHGGVYGPFLELAKVSEGEDGVALAEQAGMLGLSAEQFNRAQMQALQFAETMEL